MTYRYTGNDSSVILPAFSVMIHSDKKSDGNLEDEEERGEYHERKTKRNSVDNDSGCTVLL